VPQILLQLARGVAIGGVIMLPCLLITWWFHRRDRLRWELQEQLRELEEQIREETLPDWQREVILGVRQRRADIARGPASPGPAGGGGPVTDDQRRGHFRRLNGYCDRIVATLDRITADLMVFMGELRSGSERLDARQARLPCTWPVVGAFVALAGLIVWPRSW
jgi:hypothetical protein